MKHIALTAWNYLRNLIIKYKLQIAIFALFIILAVILYYPLSLHLATRSVEDVPKDSAFNMWIIGWGNHALTHYPWRFFEANMFYPYSHVLAWGDNLFSVTLTAMPLIPILGIVTTYNLLLVAFVALSGFTMYLLLKYLTDDWVASFIGGCLWCISIARLTDGHIQVLAMYWIPLIFMYSEKLRVANKKKYEYLLTIVLFMQITTGIYIAIYTALSYSIYLTCMIAARKMNKKFASQALRAWGIVGILSLPVYLPSLILNFTHPTIRSLSENRSSSLTWPHVNPLGIPGVIWKNIVNGHTATQPAYYTIGLLLSAAVIGSAAFILYRKLLQHKQFPQNSWLALSFLLIGIFGILSSFGPYIATLGDKSIYNPFFMIPYALLPGYKVMRIPSRWHFLGTFGLAAFAGFYLPFLTRRLRGYWKYILLIGTCIWLIIEMAVFDQGKFIAPNYHTHQEYAWLKKQPGEFAIVELPIFPGKYYYQNDVIEGYRTYFAAQDFKRRADGAFSPFIPAGYTDKAGLINSLGDNPKAIEYLRKNSIKMIIVHPQDYATLGWSKDLSSAKIKQFDNLTYLERVYSSPTGIVYKVK